jgi:hypothetical protein
LELELESQEQEIGPFRADIVCKETERDQRVVIENQIEDTDHSHLGQILTYAAGLDASTVVWVAQKFTEEHRAALDWLNEHANGSARFFGVEIELFRIGDSLPAPRFSVVAKPNDFSSRLRKAADQSGMTEVEKLRLKYWTQFRDCLKNSRSQLRFNKEPNSRPVMRIQSPLVGFRAGFEARVRHGCIYTYIGSYLPEHVEALRRIHRNFSGILKKELNAEIEWTDSANNDEFWISPLSKADLNDEKDWPRQHEWLKTTLEKLLSAISKRLDERSI